PGCGPRGHGADDLPGPRGSLRLPPAALADSRVQPPGLAIPVDPPQGARRGPGRRGQVVPSVPRPSPAALGGGVAGDGPRLVSGPGVADGAGAADVIKFGVATPLSGPAAPWGIPHKGATELIFDEINAQGGLEVGGKKYKLEVVAYDHKYVIAEGVATVNRLISKDGVHFISVLGGTVVKAIEETVNETRTLNLPLAYADGLVSPKNPYTFHSFPSPPETITFWNWIKQNHPNIKRVASITPNDDTGWWSLKVETNYVAKLGYEVVAREFFERPVTDFNPLLLRVLAQKPDIISVLAAPAGSVGLIIKQARVLGFKGRFIHLGQMDTSVVAGIAGKENVEGTWVHGYVQTRLPEKVKNWQAR